MASLPDWQRNRATRNRPQTGQTESVGAVNPVLSHTPPPKPSKLIASRCAQFVASQEGASFVGEEGAGLVEVVPIEDRESYNPSVSPKPTYTSPHDATSYAPSLRDWSKSQDRDTEQALAEITFAAFTRPWPGETGPTDARVLAGLLRQGKLTVDTALDSFSHEVGLANRTVHASLLRLAAEGWGKFELGDPDRWGSDHQLEEPGKPSTFTLHPRTDPTGAYSPMELPWLISDLFTRDALGSAGWLLLARLLVEHRDEAEPMPTLPVVGVADIIRLTGMTKWRAQRLLPKLTKVGRVEDRKATIYFLRDTTETDRSTFDCQAYYERQKKHDARSLRRNEARKAQKEANKPPAPPDQYEAVQEPEMTETDWEERRVANLAIIASITRDRVTQPEPKPKAGLSPLSPQVLLARLKREGRVYHGFTRGCCDHPPGHEIHTKAAGDYEAQKVLVDA
jgi:hypothetical protein